jgi:hypothetical protein
VRVGTQPTIETIRAICDALHRDIREGLVAAGLFTAKELKLREPVAGLDFTTVTDEELLAEVMRRMKRHQAGLGRGARVDLAPQSFMADVGEIGDEQGFEADRAELTEQPSEADSPEVTGGGIDAVSPPASRLVPDPFSIPTR